jgi:hypothetical protein
MKRPSPALIVAGFALFASLGGTGYAASQLRSPAATAASTHRPAPLTSKSVNKLIAAYLAHHHIGARGPQGPGAQRIEESVDSEVVGLKFATVGLWTLSMTCTAADVQMTINGPGAISYTESLGSFNKAATTASNSGGADGFTSDIGSGGQQGISAFLTSGTTMEQLNLEITADEGACEVLGDAIPAS